MTLRDSLHDISKTKSRTVHFFYFRKDEIMTLKKIDVEKFLKLAESIPVIDVRSPSEFISGHIPGAVNIPLLMIMSEFL